MPVTAVPAMLPVAGWTILFALALVAVIGLDLVFRQQRRREDRGGTPPMQPGDIDPVNLRRRRPLTQRLSGLALLAAAVIIFILVRPYLGL